MNASTRAALTTGVAALSLGALAITVSVPPESMRTIQVLRPANFAADIVPDGSGEAMEPPSEEDLNSALALIEQLVPVADGRVVTVRLSGQEEPGSATIAPAAPRVGAALEADGSAEITHQAAVDDPGAQNSASDAIDRIYSISRYWSSYLALELVPWLINWIPFGYLVSDQIYIWYPNLVQPTVESFVYDFLDPVVNDPLNPDVWIDGISDILSTAQTGLAAGIADEINYIVTFGWFPIPLPPLPNFPLPGLSSTSAPVAASLATIDADETGTEGTAEDATEPTDTADPATDDATEPTDATEEATEPADTTDEATEATEATDTTEEATEATDATEEATEATEATDATEEATDIVAGDGSAERATGTDAEDTVESDTEPSDESESAVESVEAEPEAEQSGDDAENSAGAQQDSASGSGDSDSDSDSAASNTSDSDEG